MVLTHDFINTCTPSVAMGLLNTPQQKVKVISCFQTLMIQVIINLYIHWIPLLIQKFGTVQVVNIFSSSCVCWLYLV